MATAVKVLDRHRFEARARVIDVLAISLLLVAGAMLAVILYKLGFSAGEVARGSNAASILDRDRQFAISIALGALTTASLCWLGFRVFSRRDG